jgi:hypothetical protein
MGQTTDDRVSFTSYIFRQHLSKPVDLDIVVSKMGAGGTHRAGLNEYDGH